MKVMVLAGGLALAMAGSAIGDGATHTSLEELRRMVPVAGAPQSVLWQTEVLGDPATRSTFPPGPTDMMLWAVVSYGSDTEAQQVLGDGPVEETTIEAPGWFPAELAPGGALKVQRHHRVKGFLDATVMTVADNPGIVILQKPLF